MVASRVRFGLPGRRTLFAQILILMVQVLPRSDSFLRRSVISASPSSVSSSSSPSIHSSSLGRAAPPPFPYSPKFPLNIVVGLPSEEGSPLRNPYKLTISKSQPVFDVAVEDIYYKRKLLPSNALRIAYEDTQLSDAVGPQKIVDRYCNRSVDVVMGMAYVFALAPVARMSQFWGTGVPVFTTSAMVDQLGDKGDFPLLTRLMGTYRTLAHMVHKMVAELDWHRFHFFFNDQSVHGSNHGRSECFFSLDAIKNVFKDQAIIIDWTVEMFSEQTASRDTFTMLLKKASFLTNSMG